MDGKRNGKGSKAQEEYKMKTKDENFMQDF